MNTILVIGPIWPDNEYYTLGSRYPAHRLMRRLVIRRGGPPDNEFAPVLVIQPKPPDNEYRALSKAVYIEALFTFSFII